MKFENLGLAEALVRAVHAQGYTHPPKFKPQPSARARRPRRAGLRQPAPAIRPRSPAHAAPLEPGGVQSERPRPQDPRADPDAHPRAGAADRRELPAYGRYTGLRHTVVYGGVSQHPQVQACNAGVDILVATPGRLLDLMKQGFLIRRRSKCWSWTRPTGCSTWDSCPICGGSSPSAPGGRRCFSRRPCRRNSQAGRPWLNDPVEVAGRAGGRTVEQSAVGRLRREGAEARAAGPLAARRPGRGRWSSRAPSTGPTRWPSGLQAGISDRRHSRQQEPEQERRSLVQAPQPLVLVATDIAARDWTRQSRTSSTTTCRSTPETTFTASAAPAGPARGNGHFVLRPDDGISCRPSSGSRGKDRGRSKAG